MRRAPSQSPSSEPIRRHDPVAFEQTSSLLLMLPLAAKARTSPSRSSRSRRVDGCHPLQESSGT
jgi:hypothetical protein